MNLSASRAWRTVAVLALVGCGFDDAEPTRISVRVPQMAYSLDTADGKRWKTPPGGVPAVGCGQDDVPGCCRPDSDATLDCQAYALACEMETCVLTLTTELVLPINLGKDAPELGGLAGRQVSGVVLKAITYKAQSSLDVDVPSVDLYVAPKAIESRMSQDAKKLGTVPAIRAGATVPEGEIVLAPGGAAAFQLLAKNYTAPFNVIAATSPKIGGDVPAPVGRLDLWIGGRAEFEVLPATK